MSVTFKQVNNIENEAWKNWWYTTDTSNRVGLLIPPSDERPTTISLADSWQNYPDSCYVFLPNAFEVDDLTEAFINALIYFLEQSAHHGVRFLWLDSNQLLPTGIDLWFFLSPMHENDGHVTDRVTSIPYMNWDLIIPKHSVIELHDDSAFTIRSGAYDFDMLMQGERKSNITGDITLEMGGDNAGLINFGFTIYDTQVLNIEMRLFYSQASNRNRAYPLEYLSYPLFNDEEVDEVGNKVPTLKKVRFVYNSSNHRNPHLKPHIANVVRSFYRTIHGYWIRLQTTDLYLLAVEHNNMSDGSGTKQRYYTPHGKCVIKIERASDPNVQDDDRLLCGLSGMEYIGLNPDVSNIMNFKAGQPAFAPDFDASPNPAPPTIGIARLQSQLTTSWLRVEHEGEANNPFYYVQPELAPFYYKNPQNNTLTVLNHAEIDAAMLYDGSENAFVPMFPYGGVSADKQKTYLLMEQQVINATRREQLALVSEPEIPADELMPAVRTTTPHGLLIDFSAGYKDIDNLILAHDTDDVEIKFTGITEDNPLRPAMQSNQLFMVMTKSEELTGIFGAMDTRSSKIKIGKWTFNLNPVDWLSEGSVPSVQTILIFKYFDKTLAELVSDASLWTLGEQHNDNMRLLQRKLLRQFKEIRKRGTTDEAYDYIANIIDDKHWSGIIALNVAMNIDDFPPDLKGLLADPNFATGVYGAYVVVETTPIHIDAETGIQSDVSSLYALVDYRAKQTPEPTTNDYDFYVSQLRVRFANSKQVEFACDIAVILNTLFKESVQLVNTAKQEYAPRNDLSLTGRYEQDENGGHYTFSFVGNNRFMTATESTIQDVSISRARFATIINGDVIASRFAFQGRINFGMQHDLFDVLSFGIEPDTAALAEGKIPPIADKYLSFANLALDMKFTIPDENATPDSIIPPEFTVDETSLVLNLAESPARSGSVFTKFPVRFNGFYSSDAGQTINQLNFMPMTTPLSGSEPGDTWYAMIYQMELGNLGALAGNKIITAQILAAWEPGSESVYVGLKLPGSTGGKREITLQGVLKIVFEKIIFNVVEVDSANTSAKKVPAYSIRMRNVQLKLLILSLPFEGKTEIMIFADPDAEQGQSLLGWYAAYAKERTVLLNQGGNAQSSSRSTTRNRRR